MVVVCQNQDGRDDEPDPDPDPDPEAGLVWDVLNPGDDDANPVEVPRADVPELGVKLEFDALGVDGLPCPVELAIGVGGSGALDAVECVA